MRPRSYSIGSVPPTPRPNEAAREPARRVRHIEREPPYLRQRGLLAAVHRPAVPLGGHVPVPDLRPPPLGLGRRAHASTPLERPRIANANALEPADAT
jgi:hypothetical protein